MKFSSVVRGRLSTDRELLRHVKTGKAYSQGEANNAGLKTYLLSREGPNSKHWFYEILFPTTAVVDFVQGLHKTVN